jgi:hypothetical protein
MHQPLQRSEHALLYFPGQDGGPLGDNYFHCVIRDFHLRRPLSDSKIRVWVLPVEGYEGHAEGYHGYSVAIPVDGFRGSELFRNKKLLHGLKEKWPGSEKCRFCMSTMGGGWRLRRLRHVPRGIMAGWPL